MRRETATLLGASGASVNLCGLYYGAGERHVDNQTFVDHAAPGASSNEVYKGILDARFPRRVRRAACS